MATIAQKTAAAAKRDRFRQLAKQVAALSDEQCAEIAAKAGIVNCVGHPLSVHNCCLAWMQRSNATMVGGFRQWLGVGRVVRKGEHGLMIWFPCKPKKDAENEKTYFMPGTVFDVSQTDEKGGAE